MTYQSNPLKRARGMALIVSLILLLSLTLLALASIQNTSLEERMAGNSRAENLALNAAETAVRAAEAWLSGLTAFPEAVDPPGNNQVWQAGQPDSSVGPDTVTPTDLRDPLKRWFLEWDATVWQGANRGVPVASVVGNELVYATIGTEEQALNSALTVPRYVIEENGYDRDSLVVGQQRDLPSNRIRYQITARGVDAGGRAEVLLSSTFRRRF